MACEAHITYFAGDDTDIRVTIETSLSSIAGMTFEFAMRAPDGTILLETPCDILDATAKTIAVPLARVNTLTIAEGAYKYQIKRLTPAVNTVVYGVITWRNEIAGP